MTRRRGKAKSEPKRRTLRPAFDESAFRIVRKPDPPDFERQMERANCRMRRRRQESAKR